MAHANTALYVLGALLGLELAAGSVFAAFMSARVAAAARLERQNRLAGAGSSVLPIVAFLLGGLVVRAVPDLVWYYIAFGVLGLAVGMAQGCVHASAALLKIDPEEHPFKAFYAGFGVQTVLLFVPVVNAFVLMWFLLWGYSGLALLALGFKAAEDGAA